MAKLTGGFAFSGSLGDISAYRKKGTNYTIIRRKGGPAKERIQKDPNFKQTRLNNNEWRGCVLALKALIRAVFAVKHLADYPYSSTLQAVCKSIQNEDNIQEKGKRSVLISQQPHRLEGFGFNRENYFETLLRHPLHYSVDKIEGKARVEVPSLIPGINFHNPKGEPLYRLVAILGVVPDIVFDETMQRYRPVNQEIPYPAECKTSWYCWKEGSGPQSLELQLENWDPVQGLTLILSAGIEFGTPITNADIKPVKYAGSARVLKVV